jgi:hypothetical protein
MQQARDGNAGRLEPVIQNNAALPHHLAPAPVYPHATNPPRSDTGITSQEEFEAKHKEKRRKQKLADQAKQRKPLLYAGNHVIDKRLAYLAVFEGAHSLEIMLKCYTYGSYSKDVVSMAAPKGTEEEKKPSESDDNAPYFAGGGTVLSVGKKSPEQPKSPLRRMTKAGSLRRMTATASGGSSPTGRSGGDGSGGGGGGSGSGGSGRGAPKKDNFGGWFTGNRSKEEEDEDSTNASGSRPEEGEDNAAPKPWEAGQFKSKHMEARIVAIAISGRAKVHSPSKKIEQIYQKRKGEREAAEAVVNAKIEERRKRKEKEREASILAAGGTIPKKKVKVVIVKEGEEQARWLRESAERAEGIVAVAQMESMEEVPGGCDPVPPHKGQLSRSLVVNEEDWAIFNVGPIATLTRSEKVSGSVSHSCVTPFNATLPPQNVCHSLPSRRG